MSQKTFSFPIYLFVKKVFFRFLFIFNFRGEQTTLEEKELFLKNLNILPRSFYARDAQVVAQELLGLYLAHFSPEGIAAGKIVETEAYLEEDPACHASRGMTERNRVMFGPPGHAYIYFIYGMYYCFNTVTGREGVGEAVLIRSLEPVLGIPLMKNRRGREKLTELCGGPGRLAQALGMKREQNGQDLTKGSLVICRQKKEITNINVITTTRIGIREGADLALRYYVAGSPFVSRK